LQQADPNAQLGLRVGGLLAQANRAVSVEASGGRAGLYAGLVERLQDDQEGLVNPNVSQVVERANSVAMREVVPRDPLCSRNWTRLCPDGWVQRGRAYCSAPAAYTGPCKRAQALTALTALGKFKFAVDCQAPWPCGSPDACEVSRDYDACPVGWGDAGGGFCKELSNMSKCAPLYKFDQIPIAGKQELTAACGIQWPCRPHCDQDFSSSCPEVALQPFAFSLRPVLNRCGVTLCDSSVRGGWA